MIDVKATILQTIIKQFERLRKLADNDTSAFKKILYLIVMDDLYEWGVYLGVDDCVLQELSTKRSDYILCNSIFRMKEASRMKPYVSVNTPQSNDTWKRVWDAPDLSEIDLEKIEELSEEG